MPELQRLNVLWTPLARLGGFAGLALGAYLHNRFILDSFTWTGFLRFTSILLLYALGTWLVLYRFFPSVKRIHLGRLFLATDIPIFTYVIYYTGANQSWFYFLMLVRVADQIFTNRRRALGFAHLSVACYVVLLLYVSLIDQRPVNWSVEAVKLVLIYGTAAYLAFAAKIPWHLKQKTQTAREMVLQLARNEMILNSAGEGIFGLDLRGRATFVNPSAARMLGWDVEELIGRPVHATIHHSRADGSFNPPEHCRLCTTPRYDAVPRVSENVLWRRDGTSFPVEYVNTPLREGGAVVGAVVTFRDITERRAVERMKEEFLSVVSHELRTPLTSIRGSLGLLASGRLGALPERGRRMVDIAIANTDRLTRLINDILDSERLETGKIELQKAACLADKLIGDAVDVMRAMAERSGIVVEVNAASVQLVVDPDRILQTLTNLLSNAFKFSPPGSKVVILAQQNGQDVLFQVRDQGRGIPPDRLERIFERFQQVDASDAREKGGSGLGLSICRAIVRQHGGRIWAESAPGSGSTFSFTLPAERQGAAVAATAERPS